MKSSTVSYMQSLKNQGGVNDPNRFFFTPNLQMVIIIKKGENVNHASYDDVKKNILLGKHLQISF